MPNNYFEFKQFKGVQDKCAMKVCTDACLFGAWIAEKMFGLKDNVSSILDIGTGTGLLSLMLSQKVNCVVDAVEIDTAAADQAKENFELTKWQERLRIYPTSIQEFKSGNNYDVIISNPPFFKNALPSGSASKNLAKHVNNLSFEVLIQNAKSRLSDNGFFCVLLPYDQSNDFERLAEANGLHVVIKADVKQTTSHAFFRTMSIFSVVKRTYISTEIITMKDDSNHYTSQFVNLLKDYYLHL